MTMGIRLIDLMRRFARAILRLPMPLLTIMFVVGRRCCLHISCLQYVLLPCFDLGVFSGFFGRSCRDVLVDAKAAEGASGAFTACLVDALSYGNSGYSEASVHIRQSLLHAGLEQEPEVERGFALNDALNSGKDIITSVHQKTHFERILTSNSSSAVLPPICNLRLSRVIQSFDSAFD
jgi:hypothetical protein